MFSEMFKAFEMSDLNIAESSDTSKRFSELLPFIFFNLILISIIAIKLAVLDNFVLNNKLALIGDSFNIAVVVLSSFIFFFNIFNSFNDSKNNDHKDKYKGIFLALITIFSIIEIINLFNSEYNIFKPLEQKMDDGLTYKLINPKFNAKTATILSLLAIVVLCGIHTFKYDFKATNFWYYLLIVLFIGSLFMFVFISSLDLNFDKNTSPDLYKNLKTTTDICIFYKLFALVSPVLIYIFWVNSSSSDDADTTSIKNTVIKTFVLYYALLFLVFLFYVYFMNKSTTIGILSLQYFQLYNFEYEKTSEKKNLQLHQKTFIKR